jgi:hypothetical protein
MPPPCCGSGKVFAGLVTVVGVVTGLLTGAVGLVKNPGMVGMGNVTGDGIVVRVGLSGRAWWCSASTL